MQNVTKSGSTNIAALAASVLGAVPGANAGGTAVMDKPVAAPRKRRSRAASVVAAAAIAGAAMLAANTTPVVDAATESALGLTPGASAAVMATKGKNLRDSTISKRERKAAHVAAVENCLAIGLGEKAAGHGPITRSVLLRMAKSTFNLKSVQIANINSVTLRAILGDINFKANAHAALAAHLADLQARAAKVTAKTGKETSATTLETRTENVAKAKKWIDAGMNAVYLQSLTVIEQLGNRITISGIALPVDRLLGVAFGKNITASELLKGSDTVAIVKA